MTPQRTFPLVAGPDGWALLASSVVARLPLAMLSIAILVHVQRLTGSFAVAGVACSAYAICGALASPILGRRVDRRGQTQVLLAGATLTALALIATGLLPADAPPAVLVALAGVSGLATPPLAACVRTLLPAIVSRPSQLPALFALESTLLEVTFVLGPPLALGLGAVWSTGGGGFVAGHDAEQASTAHDGCGGTPPPASRRRSRERAQREGVDMTGVAWLKASRASISPALAANGLHPGQDLLLSALWAEEGITQAELVSRQRSAGEPTQTVESQPTQ
jgi:hypothetical protein